MFIFCLIINEECDSTPDKEEDFKKNWEESEMS